MWNLRPSFFLLLFLFLLRDIRVRLRFSSLACKWIAPSLFQLLLCLLSVSFYFFSLFLFVHTSAVQPSENALSLRGISQPFIMRPARDISRPLIHPLRLTKGQTGIKFDLFSEMEVGELLLYEAFPPSFSFDHPTCCMWLVGRAEPWYVLCQEAAVSNSVHNSFDSSRAVQDQGEAWRPSLLIKGGSAYCCAALVVC